MSETDEYALRSPEEELHQGPPAAVSQDDTSSRGMLISEDKLVFSPPLYVQRYQAVQEIITSSKVPMNKIVDIGSAELTFFRHLRHMTGVQEVLLLDINEETLQNSKYRVQPFMADFLIRRREPLTVKVVCGDARVYDPLLSGAQAVTLIEVIEHMNLCDLPALVQCVFQQVKPHLVVVTTPNADFDKFFPNHTPGKFRHWDHKFEWTAEEFQHWCLGVVEEHQDYKVEFSGRGLGPDGTCCSQIASFWHHTGYQEHPGALLNTDITATSIGEAGGTTQTACLETMYKIVAECKFPVDMRTKGERDADHALNRFTSLRNFLVTGERQDIDSSVPPWQYQDEGPGILSPLNASSSSDCVHYLTQHYDNEEAVCKAEDVKNEYCFYIIDNRYALIPMRSLAQWVNEDAEIDLADEIISKAVEGECIETQGRGSSWVGKMMLYEERVSSPTQTESDSKEDVSYVRWPSSEVLHNNVSCSLKDEEGISYDLENWN